MENIQYEKTILPQEDLSEDMPKRELKIGINYKEGKCQGLEFNIDEMQAIEKDSENRIKPIPNSEIFESQKKLDEIQRKVEFYIQVRKIEPQIPIEQKIDWLMEAHNILSIKS